VCNLVCYLLRCSVWTVCSSNVFAAGCTYFDIMVPVLTDVTSRWHFLFHGDVVTKYTDTVDAMHHMCRTVVPGTDA